MKKILFWLPIIVIGLLLNPIQAKAAEDTINSVEEISKNLMLSFNKIFITDIIGVSKKSEEPTLIVIHQIQDIYDSNEFSEFDPYLILAMCYSESRFDSQAKKGSHKGLLQITAKWHQERMEQLGVEDLYDINSNLRVGVDIIIELLEKYNGNIEKALMYYNEGYDGVIKYDDGKISSYASEIVKKSEEYRKENYFQ